MKYQGFLVNFSLSQLLGAGVHLGHLKNSWNFESSIYLLGIRNFMCIFNLEQAILLLKQALKFIVSLISNRGQMMLVSRLNKFINVNKDSFSNQSFITVKPLGGVLTNLKGFKFCYRFLNNKTKQPYFYIKFFNYILLVFKVFSFMRSRFEGSMISDLDRFELNKIIKKYRSLILILMRYYKVGFHSSRYLPTLHRQLRFYIVELRKSLMCKHKKIKFFKFLSSLDSLQYLGCVFISDLLEDSFVLRESIKLQLPSIGIVDSDCNLSGLTYPILGNNDSPKVLQLYLNLISQAIIKGKNIEKLNLSNTGLVSIKEDHIKFNLVKPNLKQFINLRKGLIL